MPRKLSWKSRSETNPTDQRSSGGRAQLAEGIADCLSELALKPLSSVDQFQAAGPLLNVFFSQAEPDLLILVCPAEGSWRTCCIHQSSPLALPMPTAAWPADLPGRLQAGRDEQNIVFDSCRAEFPPDWAKWAQAAGVDGVRLFPRIIRARGIWFFSGGELHHPDWSWLLDLTARLLSMAIVSSHSVDPPAEAPLDSALERVFPRWLKAREPRVLCEMLGQELAGEFGLDRYLFCYEGLDDSPAEPLAMRGFDRQTAARLIDSLPAAKGSTSAPRPRLVFPKRNLSTTSVGTHPPGGDFLLSMSARAHNGVRVTGLLGSRAKVELTAAGQHRLKCWLARFELALDNQQRSAQLEALSYTDSVTGIFNRRFFKRRLAEETTRALRFGRSLSLLVFDLDNFKDLNDTYGHQAGDLVLREVAELLLVTIRSIDIACRYGGDEFVIVMPETVVRDCFSFTNRLRRAIFNHAFQPGGQGDVFRLTISLGAAVFPEHADGPERLFWCADMAMLKAKEAGRNRAMLYQPGMDCSPRSIGR